MVLLSLNTGEMGNKQALQWGLEGGGEMRSLLWT